MQQTGEGQEVQARDGLGQSLIIAHHPAKSGDPAVTRFDYPTATGVSKELVYYEVTGGGHTWPGAIMPKSIAAKLGANTSNLDATRTIWEFFERL